MPGYPRSPSFLHGYRIGWSPVRIWQVPVWQMKSIFIIFLYLHLSLVFLLKCPILQVFSAFSCFCVSGVSSQIFPYFLVLFPPILVNPLVNKCSVPTGCFRLLLLEVALPVRHRTAHGCKHSALRWCPNDPWYTATSLDSFRISPYWNKKCVCIHEG